MNRIARLISSVSQATASKARRDRRTAPAQTTQYQVEHLEGRLLFTINLTLPVGGVLNINPIVNHPSNPFGSNLLRVDVGLASAPGLTFGRLFRVQGHTATPWGTLDPSRPSASFAPAAAPHYSQNRLGTGMGFRYANISQTLGFTDTIPIAWVHKDQHTQADTLVITTVPGTDLPMIVTQPAGITPLALGESTTLTVQATGSGLSYQWYEGTSPNTSKPVAGATTSSLVVNATQKSSTQKFWVRVSNSVGTVESATATVFTASPVTANAGGPYVVGEAGRGVMMQASAINGSGVFYWDFNYDALFTHAEGFGANAIFRSPLSADGGDTLIIGVKAVGLEGLFERSVHHGPRRQQPADRPLQQQRWRGRSHVHAATRLQRGHRRGTRVRLRLRQRRYV